MTRNLFANYFRISYRYYSKRMSLNEKWTRVPWVAVVPESDGTMKITCTHAVQEGKPRVYNMLRKSDEPLHSALKRLACNMEKQLNKKNKKKPKKSIAEGAVELSESEKSSAARATPDLEESCIEMAIYKDGGVINPEVTNEMAWTTSSVFHVQDSQYEIQVNPPTCDKVGLHRD